MRAKEYADGRGEGMADRLRHITAESGHETISRRVDVDDAVVEQLRPLVARAIDTGEQVDIPDSYWIRAEEQEIATLAVAIGHTDTGADVRVSMVVSRGPSHKLPVLRVCTGAKALREIASELRDLDRCIAWAFLELWEQKHRAMGEILHAILEEERAYWSTVRW
ncbi:MAG: hypothetical protein OXG60_11920 [Chloroflexi bacterium]|nr:hypothetical protein [Chloroflexota bacterium]